MTVEVTHDVNTMSDAEFDTFFNEQSKEAPEAEIETPTEESQPDEVPEVQSEEVETESHAEEEAEETPQADTHEARYKAMADQERIRRKEIQKQIEHLKSENENIKNTFQRILAKAQEQSERDQKASEPNFEDDPLAALHYENKKLKGELEQVKQTQTSLTQQQEQARQQQQFINTYREKTNEFAKITPDFDAAYNFLNESRFNEFVLAGYEEDQARELVLQDEAAIAANSLRTGKNPGEVLYQLAKQRGYRGNAPQSESKVSQKIAENEKKIATLQKGLAASKSVNSHSSSDPSVKPTLTLEQVASMDDDEFDKMDWNKVLKLG